MSKMKKNSSKSQMENQCQECGCHCDSCVNNNSIHLHQEIEDLKQKLKDREQQILTMESQILGHANKFPNGEMQALRDNLYHWQDKHERLLENYRKLQKVNQSLEDKLLRVADRFENEKISIAQNMADLTNDLNETKAAMIEARKINETYRNDYDSIIRFIQSQSIPGVDLYSLPDDLQIRARQYFEEQKNLAAQQENGCEKKKSYGFPLLPTFPPTAVLYSDWPERNHNNSHHKNNNSDPPRMLTSSMFYQIFKIQNQHQQTDEGKNNLCNNCNKQLIMNNDDYGNNNDDNNGTANDGRHKTIVI